MNPIAATKSDEELIIDPDLKEIVSQYIDWENLPRQHFLRQVELGRMGKNIGWGNGFKRINNYLHGTHRGRYYLIGADSGVGKTTYADFSYMLELYEYARAHNKKWYCFYYTFELSKTEKIARWVSYYLHRKFNIIMPSNYILGRISGNLPSDKDMEYIRIAYAHVERMCRHVTFIEESVNPTSVLVKLRDHYKKIGTVHEGPKFQGKEYGPIIGYTPNPGEEDSMTTVFLDHLALTHHEQGLDNKGTMDLLSKYAVATRNLFETTWVILQQFSTDMQSWHRSARKVTDKFIAPQRLDFGDTKYTYRDADVVLGLVAPHQFDLDKYYGYDIERLITSMLGVHIMKNRYGPASVMLPMFLHTLSGVLEELPTDTHELSLEEYFNHASKLEQLCQKFSPKV